MIVNVRMADGHTTFQFASRGDLQKVLKREAADDGRPVECFAKWSLDDEAPWVPVRGVHVRRHSIAFVVSAEDMAAGDDDLPAKVIQEIKAAKWAEKQQAEQAEVAA